MKIKQTEINYVVKLGNMDKIAVKKWIRKDKIGVKTKMDG